MLSLSPLLTEAVCDGPVSATESIAVAAVITIVCLWRRTAVSLDRGGGEFVTHKMPAVLGGGRLLLHTYHCSSDTFSAGKVKDVSYGERRSCHLTCCGRMFTQHASSFVGVCQ